MLVMPLVTPLVNPLVTPLFSRRFHRRFYRAFHRRLTGDRGGIVLGESVGGAPGAASRGKSLDTPRGYR